METVYFKLPIRLVPRTDSSTGATILLGAVTAFCILVTLAVGGQIEALNHLESHGPPEFRYYFALAFGLFTLLPLWGLIKSASQLLPGSPLFHLQVSAKGITLRDFPRKQAYAWSDLSGFRVVKRTRRGKRRNDSTNYYLVNAVPPELADKLLDDDPFYTQPIFSLDADEFGAQDGHFDAQNPAEWLNELRGLALKGELRDGDCVAAAAGFESITSSITKEAGATTDRRPTIVRRQ